MNLDERIEQTLTQAALVRVAPQPAHDVHVEIDWKGATGDIKQLIRDVLEYVKPDTIDKRPATEADAILIGTRNGTVAEFERKAKELGL